MADDPTLTPDVPTISTGAGSLKIAVKEIFQYCAAVGGIQTGPQMFDSGGITGTADPFQTLADVKNAVITAQSHTYTFFPTIFAPLVEWTSSLSDFAQTFSSDTATILTTIAAIGSGAPTAVQRQTITSALTDIENGLTALQNGMQALQPKVAQFDSWIDSDNAALTVGPAAMQTAITNLENWFTNFEIPFAGGVGGEGIVDVIGLIEQRFITPMQTALNELQNATRLSASTTFYFSQFLDFISDLVAKCGGVVTFVTNASDADFVSYVQRVDLLAAEAAWTQLGQFVQQTFDENWSGI
jgi:hypothetical protein